MSGLQRLGVVAAVLCSLLAYWLSDLVVKCIGELSHRQLAIIGALSVSVKMLVLATWLVWLVAGNRKLGVWCEWSILTLGLATAIGRLLYMMALCGSVR
jgi:hypothetical protein